MACSLPDSITDKKESRPWPILLKFLLNSYAFEYYSKKLHILLNDMLIIFSSMPTKFYNFHSVACFNGELNSVDITTRFNV